MLTQVNGNVDYKALGCNRASLGASTQDTRSKNTFSGAFSRHTRIASVVNEEGDKFGFADKDEDRTSPDAYVVLVQVA